MYLLSCILATIDTEGHTLLNFNMIVMHATRHRNTEHAHKVETQSSWSTAGQKFLCSVIYALLQLLLRVPTDESSVPPRKLPHNPIHTDLQFGAPAAPPAAAAASGRPAPTSIGNVFSALTMLSSCASPPAGNGYMLWLQDCLRQLGLAVREPAGLLEYLSKAPHPSRPFCLCRGLWVVCCVYPCPYQRCHPARRSQAAQWQSQPTSC